VEPITEKRDIETRPDKCGGKPCIAGTRIRVWDIHVWHDLKGESPEQIAANFPQITVADEPVLGKGVVSPVGSSGRGRSACKGVASRR
jgi:uncharacterized protein (DUF433 family)